MSWNLHQFFASNRMDRFPDADLGESATATLTMHVVCLSFREHGDVVGLQLKVPPARDGGDDVLGTRSNPSWALANANTWYDDVGDILGPMLDPATDLFARALNEATGLTWQPYRVPGSQWQWQAVVPNDDNPDRPIHWRAAKDVTSRGHANPWISLASDCISHNSSTGGCDVVEHIRTMFEAIIEMRRVCFPFGPETERDYKQMEEQLLTITGVPWEPATKMHIGVRRHVYVPITDRTEPIVDLTKPWNDRTVLPSNETELIHVWGQGWLGHHGRRSVQPDEMNGNFFPWQAWAALCTELRLGHTFRAQERAAERKMRERRNRAHEALLAGAVDGGRVAEKVLYKTETRSGWLAEARQRVLARLREEAPELTHMTDDDMLSEIDDMLSEELDMAMAVDVITEEEM
jgi:hypothetical protein